MGFSLKIKTVEVLRAAERLALKADCERAVKAHLDAVAQLRRYDDARALLGYWNSTREDWREEARVFGAWQDAVWTLLIGVFEAAERGQDLPETVEEVIAILPAPPWSD